MRKGLNRLSMILLLRLVQTQDFAMAQQPDSEAHSTHTSGTLNIIFANANGFVMAADSRMSGRAPFLCVDTGRLQLDCDNSQKLFQTTPHSALVIAGFAVDREASPLDLAIASILLKEFGPHGLASDERAQFVPDQIKGSLSEALRNVSALQFPLNPGQFEPQVLYVTFARTDETSKPILRQLIYREKLRQTPPLQAYVPDFEVQDSGEVPITKFFQHPFVGLPYVAQAIFDGYWKSKDADILNYYERKKRGELDSMPLIEMQRLAGAILNETGKYINAVGGGLQIGVFPTSRTGVEFTLPRNLPVNAMSIPSVLTWVGLNCSGKSTPCNGPVSFSTDSDRLQGSYNKFFLASQFENIEIALEDNIFIGSKFDGVTFMWTGGKPFMLHNKITNCTLEVPQALPSPNISELQGCRIVRKAAVSYSLDVVGARAVFHFGSAAVFQPHP